MKLHYLIYILLIISCSGPQECAGIVSKTELIIPLTEKDNFIFLSFNVSIMDGEPVVALYNMWNGELRLSNLETGKDFFKKIIPLDGPNSIPEHFLVNTHIGEDGVFLISNAGSVVYIFNKKGDLIETLKLPDFEEDHGYLYFSDGNKLFFNQNNKLYLNYFAGLYPSRNPNKTYHSILSVSLENKTYKHLAPLPQENVEKFWGEGHMLTGPFGIYSTYYQGLITGFSISNILRIYDLQGSLLKEIQLDLNNWKKPIPTDLKYEDLASLSQEAIYELRAYSGQQQKVWKILEMDEGFLIEVLEPDSEAQLPRFSVYKFDKDFNFLSSRAFLDDHYTCYQSFVLNNMYHLVDLKAYQENEDELKFGVFGFEDL